MKPEAQRIAIAEACGWKAVRMSRRWELSDDPSCPQDWCGRHPVADYWSHLPDYPTDLNAMHEAWATLSENDKYVFDQELRRVILRSGDSLWIVNASAAQRAEAFLRTIGKWEEA